MQRPQYPIQIRCIYRPPCSNNSDNQRLTQAHFYHSCLPSNRKKIAGNFKGPKIRWSSLSAPSTLRDFVLGTHANEWTQQVTPLTSFRKVLYLAFTHSTPNSRISVIKPFLGSDHNMVSCNSLFLANPACQCKLTILSLHIYRRVGTKSLTLCEPLFGPDSFYRLTRRMRQKNFTQKYINCLSTPATQNKPKKPGKLCQLPMIHLMVQKIFDKTGDFLL